MSKPFTRAMTDFRSAMEQVYGPFSQHSINTLSSWTPPPMTEGHNGRYLWTDAFGVCNFLTLFHSMRDQRYLTLASRLILTVHNTLGRTRDGTARLPGASDEHPLRGGLRIGKEDEDGLDGDGQYFHYLTVWMFALNRMTVVSGDSSYNDLAIDLARTVHPNFMLDRESSRPRMVWKMSMDLKRPLVSSEGNLDPIDGYVTFRLLQRVSGDAEILKKEISEYKKIVGSKWKSYRSDDPLDLGMTLWTVHWFSEGTEREKWAEGLRNKAFHSLETLFNTESYFDPSFNPLSHRLAFREFGTCLGIKCHPPFRARTANEDWDARASGVVKTWEDIDVVPVPKRLTSVGKKLVPITLVMYCTAVEPGVFRKGYLSTGPVQ